MRAWGKEGHTTPTTVLSSFPNQAETSRASAVESFPAAGQSRKRGTTEGRREHDDFECATAALSLCCAMLLLASTLVPLWNPYYNPLQS